MVKNLLAMWENLVQSLGWEDSLEESMANQLGILVWKIPMDLPGWLQSRGRKESDTTEHTCTHGQFLLYNSLLSLPQKSLTGCLIKGPQVVVDIDMYDLWIHYTLKKYIYFFPSMSLIVLCCA